MNETQRDDAIGQMRQIAEQATLIGRLASSLECLVECIENASDWKPPVATLSRRLLNEIGFVNGKLNPRVADCNRGITSYREV